MSIVSRLCNENQEGLACSSSMYIVVCSKLFNNCLRPYLIADHVRPKMHEGNIYLVYAPLYVYTYSIYSSSIINTLYM